MSDTEKLMIASIVCGPALAWGIAAVQVWWFDRRRS